MALFVFNGDPMCFIHVLLNALDMKAKGYKVKVIIEGAATKLVPELAKEDNPLHKLRKKAKSAGEFPLKYSGQASRFQTYLPVSEKGTYELIVYVYDPANGNTGLDIIYYQVNIFWQNLMQKGGQCVNEYGIPILPVHWQAFCWCFRF